MPAIAKLTKSQKRANFSRMLLTLGACIASGISASDPYAVGQECDRCNSSAISSREATCGCETSMQLVKRSKQTNNGNCSPQPSFAEKFLKRLDLLGDRLEAKGKKPCVTLCRTPQPTLNCDCAIVKVQNCTCDSCTSSPIGMQPTFSSPSAKTTYPFPDQPGQHAIGTIGDQHASTPSAIQPITPKRNASDLPISPGNLPPITTRQEIGQSATKPQPIPPAPTTVGPNIPKDPFEKRSPEPQRRIPAETPKLEQSLPDVLVDPFKDDASAMRTRENMEEVLLTSGRRIAKPGLRLKTPILPENADEPPLMDAPIRLTPQQRQIPSIEFDALEPTSPTSVDPSKVIPSSFYGGVPVKTAPRRPSQIADIEHVPSVNRIQVPERR